jgi:hypothetical protein
MKLTEEVLTDWITHLQDSDSTGAWNQNDLDTFKQILENQEKAEKWDNFRAGLHPSFLTMQKENKQLKFDIKLLAQTSKTAIEDVSNLKVKGQKYDDLMNANSQVVKDNITLTQLQQKLDKIEEWFETHSAINKTAYKEILERKE